jgi:hypothetical protein
MKRIKGIYPNLFIMIGFIIFGVAIGILFGYCFMALDEAGAFGGGSWKLLESPIKFKHIAQATTRTVWARTENNRFYFKDIHCPSYSDCDSWIEIKETSIDRGLEPGIVVINEKTCTPVGIKYPRDPYGNVIECALAKRGSSVDTMDIVYYALLDDGTIWVWDSSGPWYVTFDMWFLLFSPFLGLVLGVFMFRSFRKYQKTRINANK